MIFLPLIGAGISATTAFLQAEGREWVGPVSALAFLLVSLIGGELSQTAETTMPTPLATAG